MFNPIHSISSIPKETERSARAIFGRNNFYILVGDQLESILKNIQAEWILEEGTIFPQITIFQFLEGMTDVQAFHAVRTRLDWKFALHLPVSPPIFRENALCEFRRRVLIDPVCQRKFQKLVYQLFIFNPPRNNRLQVENLEVASTVCSINCLGLIYETISQALENLACQFPMWLQKIVLPHWYRRYNHIAPGFDPIVSICQFDSNASLSQYDFSLQEIYTDIHYLLKEVRCSGSGEIKKMHEIKILDHIWKRQFEKPDQVTNDQDKFLKFNDCDFCIYKERRSSGGTNE